MTYDWKPLGEMKVFESGAKREAKDGKGRPDLISPIMLHRLAVLMEKGGVAHGDRSWELGMPLSGLLSSASRHLNQTIDGCEDEDHPIQAIWNLMAYVHTLHRIRAGSLPVELDDLPREKNLEANLTSDKKGSTIEESGTLKCPDCCGSFNLAISTYCVNTVYCRRCGQKWKLGGETQ